MRPVHTVVMGSFIADNGIESSLNRGKFYGYRNAQGTLEGIALIGHTTLVEARTEKALKALAFAARSSETPIHLIMSDGKTAKSFWKYFQDGVRQPRLTCTEKLFEISFRFLVPERKHEIRQATLTNCCRLLKPRPKSLLWNVGWTLCKRTARDFCSVSPGESSKAEFS